MFIRERELNTTALEANIQHLKTSCKYMFEVRAFNNIGFGQTAGPFAVTTQDEGKYCLHIFLQMQIIDYILFI